MAYRDKADLYEYQIERWRRVKLKAIAYKGGSCEHCAGTFPAPAMQFHHRDPANKDVQWVKLRLRSWAKIVAELDKCSLLCANCHAVVHSAEWPGRQDSNLLPIA